CRAAQPAGRACESAYESARHCANSSRTASGGRAVSTESCTCRSAESPGAGTTERASGNESAE
ncbi:MAG: hypothetical protein WB683_13925, partial [Candidatus Sulfotelmatobacter sp.]